MTHTYKPNDYNSVAPYLIVDGASQTIDFLMQTFDAVKLRHMSDPSCKIIHAEVRIDDSVVMLADCTDEWPAIPANVHIYVPDVEVTYQRALAAGAETVQVPTKKDDADKRGGVKDAGGTTWWIATQVE